jgi:filamentous hemagglutinin family protein
MTLSGCYTSGSKAVEPPRQAMPHGLPSCRLGPPLIAALLFAGPVHAQIVTDGSVGPKVSLRGGQIEIGADLGSRRGDNLFHSFEKFGIATGQTATFTGPGAIKNVISRVTGGEVSNIDGKLASKVGQADLYLLNPAGVMFGPNATLDVPGSFHVSTAHELRFADGASFSAVDQAGSGLTVAAPEAFGFLDRPPSRITVDRSRMEIAPGKALSLIGGDIDIAGGPSGSISAMGGTVTLTSVAGAGQSRIADGAVDAARQGTVRARDQTRITTSGNNGGNVRVRSGVLTIDNSTIAADRTGELDTAGGIDLQAGFLSIINGSTVSTDTSSAGQGGTTTVSSDQLELRRGGVIRSNTLGTGQAGTVSIRTGNFIISSETDRTRNFTGISSATEGRGNAGTVNVRTSSLSASGEPSTLNVVTAGILTDALAGSSGNAGEVMVNADKLTLRRAGVIRSATWASGDAGTVSVRADELRVSGGAQFATGIMSDADFSPSTGVATGNAGRVVVKARELGIFDGGVIRSDTWGPGNAGPVSVRADHLLISDINNTGITSDARRHRTTALSLATGDAGSITVDVTGTLELRGGAEIHSDTQGAGNAGAISVKAGHLLIAGRNDLDLDNNTRISSETQNNSTGNAGNITVDVTGTLELRNGSMIRTNTRSRGKAGTVRVHADRLLTSNDGAITVAGISSATSSRSTGAGGEIIIDARQMALSDGSAISAESQGSGQGGDIGITVGDTLELDNSSIKAETATAPGGRITVAVGRLFDLKGSRVTTSVAGGTGSGGNIFINPHLMVLDNSRIEANAQRGAGGNITIRAGQLIRTPDSVIRASSELGLSGTISIAAPNTDVAGNLVVLPETFFDVSSELRVACAARGGRPASSFSAGGRGGLPPDPGAPLAASSFGQPLEQQTATESPTPLTARSPQAAKPITVSGIPQPVLGSPRLTCQG